MPFKCSIEAVHYRYGIEQVLEAENILLLGQETSACKYHFEVERSGNLLVEVHQAIRDTSSYSEDDRVWTS